MGSSNYSRTAILAGLLAIGPFIFAAPKEYDVIVYGGSPAGITSSIQAARMGQRVALIEPSPHLGGRSTETGSAASGLPAYLVGGITREFHQRIWAWYADDSHWPFQRSAEYAGFISLQAEPDNKKMWSYEPHVAERVFDDLLREAKVHVILGRTLKQDGALTKEGTRILSLELQNGEIYAGKMFIDTSGTGDLMTLAGVTTQTGRETNERYGESLNGMRPVAGANNTWARWKVDGYAEPGDSESKWLGEPGPSNGDEMREVSHLLDPMEFRLCVTNIPHNRHPWIKPASYHEPAYELALRIAEKTQLKDLILLSPLPNGKSQLTLGQGLACLLPLPDLSQSPTGSKDRRKLQRQQREWIQGLMWTIANDERVPETIRKPLQELGPCRDEWRDQEGWPAISPATATRRLVSGTVMTEKEVRGTEPVADSVGLSAQTLTLHALPPVISEKGQLAAEAPVTLKVAPHPVSFRALFPKPTECINLIVPNGLSASYVAAGGLRDETVLMILGQSAGTLAAMAIDNKVEVSALEYAKVRARLLADGQVLEDEALRREVKAKVDREKSAADAVLDDLDRKTQERARARTEAQEKRRQQSRE